MRLKSTYLKKFNDVSLFFNFFSNIHEMANFANKIICVSDNVTKLLFGTNFSSLLYVSLVL